MFQNNDYQIQTRTNKIGVVKCYVKEKLQWDFYKSQYLSIQVPDPHKNDFRSECKFNRWKAVWRESLAG